jgi:hypothetical protein
MGRSSSRNILVLLAFPLFFPPYAAATDTGTGKDYRLTLYAARDLCVGPIAKFANTPDPEGEVSFDEGKFKVVRAKGSVTIFEDSDKIEISKFDYSNYKECIEKLTSAK